MSAILRSRLCRRQPSSPTDDDRVDPLERDRTPIVSDGTVEPPDMFGERVFHVIGGAPNWVVDA